MLSLCVIEGAAKILEYTSEKHLFEGCFFKTNEDPGEGLQKGFNSITVGSLISY